MILGLITAIFAVAGIVGYYNNLYYLTYIGGIITILETLRGLFTNQLKTINPSILAFIIGWVAIRRFWLGGLLGLCFEYVIMGVGSILLLIIVAVIGKKANNPKVKKQLGEDE